MREIGEDLGEDLGDTPANISVGALVLASAALVLMDRKRKQEIRETMSMLQVIRWGSHGCPTGIPLASCDHQRSSVVITITSRSPRRRTSPARPTPRTDWSKTMRRPMRLHPVRRRGKRREAVAMAAILLVRLAAPGGGHCLLGRLERSARARIINSTIGDHEIHRHDAYSIRYCLYRLQGTSGTLHSSI